MTSDATRMSVMVVQTRNARVLEYLSRGKLDVPAFAPRSSVEDPYYMCGCHPEVVERIWDQIGAALPSDCRCLIFGTPALVHPKVGIILAIGIGTQYGLRLPGTIGAEAIEAGARTFTTWTDGGDTDTQRDLGEDWVFGAWHEDELDWSRRVYESFAPAA